ncbi:hypothetical protein ACQJBY_030783 [Aegilops geniculata]
MSKLILDICAEVGVPNSIVCPHHIFYFTVLIRSSTSVDRCLNAMFPLSWPRSSKEMTAMFSFGLVILEIITGKRAVLSDEPDEDDETLVSWVGLSQVPWSPPPLIKLGAKSEELLFASPRLAQAMSSGCKQIFLSALSLVSTLAFIANNTRMLHN